MKSLAKTLSEIHVTTSLSSETESRAQPSLHRCDLSADALRRILNLTRPDVLISAVAGGSFETQKRIIDCAVECGAQRFIPCEFGQDSLNTKIQSRLPPSAERVKVIRYLEELASQGKLSWVGVAVGTILDRGLLSGNLGFDLKWHSATLHGKGDEVFAASSAVLVGRAVTAVIEHWEEVKSRYLHVAGFTTTADEVVGELERATGQNWTVGRAEVDECVHEAERRIERGFPDAGMFLMERSVLYDEALEAAKSFMEDDAKDILRLKPEALRDIIHHVIHEHQRHSGKADCGCG